MDNSLPFLSSAMKITQTPNFDEPRVHVCFSELLSFQACRSFSVPYSYKIYVSSPKISAVLKPIAEIVWKKNVLTYTIVDRGGAHYRRIKNLQIGPIPFTHLVFAVRFTVEFSRRRILFGNENEPAARRTGACFRCVSADVFATDVQRDTVGHANEQCSSKKHTAKATASSACVHTTTHTANEKSRYSRDVGRDRLKFPLSLGLDVKRGTDDEHQQDRDADARSYARRFQHDLSPGSCVKNKKN